MLKQLALLGMLVTLASCSSLNQQRSTPAPVEDIDASTSSQPVTADPATPSVPSSGTADQAIALPGSRTLPPTRSSDTWLDTPMGIEYNNALKEGNLAKAGALLERELAIRPREANLWLYLSYLRMQEARLDEAQGMAQRALSLSRTTAAQESANAQLERIAQVRRAAAFSR